MFVRAATVCQHALVFAPGFLQRVREDRESFEAVLAVDGAGKCFHIGRAPLPALWREPARADDLFE